MYKAHGSANIQRIDNIVVIDAVGPWNKESTVDASEFFAQAYQDLAGRPWGVIVIVNGEALYTPEACLNITRNIIRDKAQGRVLTALITSGSNFPGVTRDILTKVYEEADAEFQFFDEFEVAFKWMVEALDSKK